MVHWTPEGRELVDLFLASFKPRIYMSPNGSPRSSLVLLEA